ncbi:hypothetical protein G5G45_004369 [Vibrio vulnificus]|nr:hypothetical protein [Vibrio vulnificus]
MFGKKLKPVPREVNEKFEGLEVKRVQFNYSGGFKMTCWNPIKSKEEIWWVPNDLGNRHCKFIHKWIQDGGFPEDADIIEPPKVLFLPHSTWSNIGKLTVILSGVAAAFAAVYSALN